jgi:peptidoglycan hydrolase CwlO-like protein
MSGAKKLTLGILVGIVSVLVIAFFILLPIEEKEQKPDANAVMFEELKSEISSLNIEISGLHTEVSDLSEETKSLKTNVKDMSSEVTELQEQLESTTGELKKLKKAFKGLGVNF